MNLDSLDLAILHELDCNARITDNRLAKLTMKSKDTIRYRINKLKKQKYITSQQSFIDYTKLGLTSFKIYLTISSNKKEYDFLISWAKKRKEVFCTFEAQTGWHICLAFFCKNLLEYEKVQQELFLKFGHIITDHYLSQMTRGFVYSNILYDTTEFMTIPVFGDVVNNALDEFDKKLVNELFLNSTISYVDLTQRVGLSIEPVIRRTKELVSKGVISYFGSSINYEKLGLTKYKLFFKFKSMNDDIEKELQTYLETIYQLKNIVYLIGPYRMEVELFVKNHSEIYSVVKTIKERFPEYISNIEYTIFHSETYYPAGLNL